MAKFKRGFPGGLKYRVEPEYMVSQYELNRLKAKPFENLLSIDGSRNGEISFDTPGSRTLSQELASGISENRLCEIVRQTLQLAGLLKHIGLSIQRTILSPEYIYIESKSELLKFIYLPVNGELLGYDEVLFVKDIILQAKLSGKARIKWDAWADRLVRSSDYEGALSAMPISDSSSTSKHIKPIVEDEAETSLGDDQGFASFDDGWNTPVNRNAPVFDDDDGEAPTGLDGQNALSGGWGASPAVDDWDDEAPTGMDESQKIDAMDKDDGTFFESLSEPASNMATAKLVSLETNESIAISNNNFKLGRSRQRADYCISCNSISNVHATIIRKGNKFYLKDNRSTNSTYLDGVKVNPDAEPVELKNGSIIRLWNLEYRFVLM